MAVKVKLRRKSISGGKESLYLDFYPPIISPDTGLETRRQFLGYHVFKSPKNPLDKAHNKDTETRAEMIRQRKESELNKPEVYSQFEKDQLKKRSIGDQSFKDYFKMLSGKRKGSSWTAWESVLLQFNSFHPDEIKFKDITANVCNDFKEFLQTGARARRGRRGLAKNTAAVYFSKFRTALKQAFKDGFLPFDLGATIEGVGQEETHRNILTIDEVNALVRTECGSPVMKKAAIFSVYTGLRFSDIFKLTWGEIEQIAPGTWVINFKQQKTAGIEVMPISAEAIGLLGERKGEKEKVFEGLLYSAYYNYILAKWVGLAGITKKITFHSFRHTFATLQLTFGTDLYTVSKLLGHRDIKTTQIYAKIVDQTKRAASNRIQLDINDWK